MQYRYPVVLMRGGNSKGLFFRNEDLPSNVVERNNVLLRAVGSPGAGQVDGMGGCISNTRKVAIVGRSIKPDHDVDYTFVQLGTICSDLYYDAMCGDLVSAVGIFAMENGLCAVEEPFTQVRVFNTNLERTILVTIPVSFGNCQSAGAFTVDRIPSISAPIVIEFLAPSIDTSSQCFITGNLIDRIRVDKEKDIEVTIIDVGNPTVLVDAQALGISGFETLAQLSNNNDLLQRFEHIRSKAARLIGRVNKWQQATLHSPTIPNIVAVNKEIDPDTQGNQNASSDHFDLFVHAFINQRPHHAIPLTGLISTVASTCLSGTLTNRMLKWPVKSRRVFIKHAGGVSSADVNLDENKSGELKSVTVKSTARTIMDGYIPEIV